MAFVCLAACKPTCTVEDFLVTGVSSKTADVLKCQNRAQVKADVQKLADKLNLCTPQAMGGDPKASIGGAVSSELGTLALSEMNNLIPASWQCDPSQADAMLSAVITAACNLIP